MAYLTYSNCVIHGIRSTLGKRDDVVHFEKASAIVSLVARFTAAFTKTGSNVEDPSGYCRAANETHQFVHDLQWL